VKLEPAMDDATDFKGSIQGHEHDDSDGESITAVCKQLAPVFANMAKRKTTLFMIKVKLPVESKPTDPTSVA
jgi:hypothetical protein